MQLRDYQDQAVTDTLKSWETYASVLGCMPTGAGKTVIASELIKRSEGRALVLCHTGELVSQFAKSLWRFGLDSEIEKAELWAETHTLNGSPVVIATPQTLYSQNGKRLKRWAPDSFSLLIVDEGHHYSGAPAYEGVVKHFLSNPALRCLALTATPDRHDGIALSRICQSVAFKYEIVDMIEKGYLVGVDQYLVKIESLDLSKCRTSQGDLHGADLAAVVEQEKPLLGMADATLKTVGDKKTLVFAHSVKQAERLAEIFNRHRPGSADCVFGHTPDDKRAEVFRGFADNRLQIMVNVAVAGEGYDNPNIEAVVCAKPTKSRARYTQQIGRGLRPLDGLLQNLNSPEERKAVIAASSKPNCILEGQRVLTDRGLVPIENITSEMQVWDGVEFVSHDGAIMQGEAEVLNYAGLTATPDHRVWTSKGWQTFGRCASEQISISVTGYRGQAIRETDRHYRNCATQIWQSNAGSAMRELLHCVSEGFEQCLSSDSGVPNVRTANSSAALVGESSHRGETALHEPQVSELRTVRSAGNQVQFCLTDRHGYLGERPPWSEAPFGDRSEGQRRSLRSGQSSLSDAPFEQMQSAKEEAPTVSHASFFQDQASRDQIRGLDALQVLFPGIHAGANSGAIQSAVKQAKGRVWDILNAGPRHRFTVEGLLVSNCVVLDFVGNSGRHSLMSVADVLGGKISEQAKVRAKARILKAGRGNMLDELSLAERELREEAERKGRAGIIADARHRLTYVDPFEAFRNNARFWSKYKQRGPLTPKQRETLRRQGYNPDNFTPQEGQQIISKIFSMSDKQRAVLMRAGYSAEELSGIRKWEATKMIDVVVKNGWRRPDSPGFGVGVNQFGD